MLAARKATRSTPPRLTNWGGSKVAAARTIIEFRGGYAGAGNTNVKMFRDGRIIVGISGDFRPTEQVEGGRRVLAGVGRDSGREALVDEFTYQALCGLWQ